MWLRWLWMRRSRSFAVGSRRVWRQEGPSAQRGSRRMIYELLTTRERIGLFFDSGPRSQYRPTADLGRVYKCLCAYHVADATITASGAHRKGDSLWL